MISVRSEVQVFPGPPVLVGALQQPADLGSFWWRFGAEERHANPASGLDLVRKQDTNPCGWWIFDIVKRLRT